MARAKKDIAQDGPKQMGIIQQLSEWPFNEDLWEECESRLGERLGMKATRNRKTRVEANQNSQKQNEESRPKLPGFSGGCSELGGLSFRKQPAVLKADLQGHWVTLDQPRLKMEQAPG